MLCQGHNLKRCRVQLNCTKDRSVFLYHRCQDNRLIKGDLYAYLFYFSPFYLHSGCVSYGQNLPLGDNRALLHTGTCSLSERSYLWTATLRQAVKYS